MRQKKVKGELYTLSLSAKQRMKMGYWSEVKQAREKDKIDAIDNGKHPESVTDFYRSKLTRELSVNKNNISREEEALYLKVCNILEKDEDVVNPIRQLVDEKHYKTLDPSGQQRYILMLAAKYRELSERYRKEKSRSYN